MDKRDKIMFVKKQLTETWKCNDRAFDSEENVFIETNDTFFQMVTFGHNVVIRAEEEMVKWCFENFKSVPGNLVMDSDNFYLINKKLRSFGKKLGEENTRYLHLFPEEIPVKPMQFDYKRYNRQSVKELYKYREFTNSLDFDYNEHIAIAAYDGEKIAAVGGVDNHLGDSLWQIGIDTVVEYRNRGLGAYLVKELAMEIEKQGKLACYTTWSANIASTRVALGAGFSPVWIEYAHEDL